MAFQSVLAIDIGSTTTKAILFGSKQGEFRLIEWSGAPTTVERPHENVLIGVRNAVKKLEQKINKQLLEGNEIITPSTADKGVDAFVATSSAGGGLQMLVGGIIKKMTAESAQKAALGAGAIVMDVLSIDDGRSDLERIKRIQQLRPDMILLSGGVDGGNIDHVASLAEIVSLASPKSRLGLSYELPVVFAGNKDARPEVDKFLGEVAVVRHVDNLRPILEQEVLEPASNEIQSLFLDHVMSQAPGYNYILDMTKGKIMPTPNAVGELVKTLGRKNQVNIMTIDIGGATTDVFSTFLHQRQQLRTSQFENDEIEYRNFTSHDLVEERKFHRSVDANLGMSYSIGNVLAEAGGSNILRWLPFDFSEGELRDILSNKMIHPTVLPQTVKGLLIEHAVAREAIRLSIQRHKMIAAGLNGVPIRRSLSDVFKQDNTNVESIIKDLDLDVVIGSGGVISHAPRRSQALLIMLDSFQPQGLTEVYADSIFMMPHLGIIATLDEEKALEALRKDCLIPLGTCIAPVGPVKQGKRIAVVEIDFADGSTAEYEIISGQLKSIPLAAGEKAVVKVTPAYGYDCGDGSGRRVEALAAGGFGGIILDGRGRPIVISPKPIERIAQLGSWIKELEAYPHSFLEEVE